MRKTTSAEGNDQLKRLALPMILLVAIGCAACGEGSAVERTESKANRVILPSPTPFQPLQKSDFEVGFLDGQTEKFSQLTNRQKVVVVNFWATWCGPCRQEIPILTALDREYRDRGIEIFGLTVEEPASTRDVVAAFGEQYSIKYRIGFAPSNMFEVFSGAGGSDSIPQTFVFGRDGNLILHLRGYSTGYKFREMMEAAFEKALS
jgi:thiol-disulfide isomerase/thioredoxin